ncbi:hypothetical protein ACTXT7_005743 [Hymenolepis weldensis]
MMSLAEQRKQAVIRNLQRLRAMGALTEAQEIEMRKKYNIKDLSAIKIKAWSLQVYSHKQQLILKGSLLTTTPRVVSTIRKNLLNHPRKATLESKRQALERFILADEKRFEEEQRQKAWSRSRPLFSRLLNDSDDSDWASSGDEWFPLNPPPSSQSKRSRKQSTQKKLMNKIVLKEPVEKSPSSKSDTSGGLMELHEVKNYPTRNITRKNYKEPPADPQDDRFLCE